MNLILFRREEIASSVPVTDNGDDGRNMSINDEDDKNEISVDSNNISNTTTNKKNDAGSSQSGWSTRRGQKSSSSPDSSTHYLVDLRADVVTMKDPRIVHLTRHLNKTKDGDTFKVGILDGRQGYATIKTKTKTKNSNNSNMNDKEHDEMTKTKIENEEVSAVQDDGKHLHQPTAQKPSAGEEDNAEQTIDACSNHGQKRKNKRRRKSNTIDPTMTVESGVGTGSADTEDPTLDFSFIFDFDPMVSTKSLSSSQSQASQPCSVTVLLSMPFPRRMKLLWSQIASFGCVGRVCIVRGALSDSNYVQSSSIQPQTYEPLILEGLSQGCHTRNIRVDVHVDDVLDQQTLDKLELGMTTVDSQRNNDLRLVLDCGIEPLNDETGDCGFEDDEKKEFGNCGASSIPIGLLQALSRRRDILNSSQFDDQSVRVDDCDGIVVAIGSERGWTEDEARLFSRNGFQSVTLGPSVLRVDTAIVSALAVISSALIAIE